MKADLIIRGISQLVTPPAPGPLHGSAMRELQIIANAALAIAGGRIVWHGVEAEWRGEAAASVDCGNRAVTPALIDPHTHAVWAGDRLADFEARACGVSYEDILQRGGGIRSTIALTARAAPSELVAAARPRLHALVRSGASVVEVKSGYGFSTEAELRMLEAIARLASGTAAQLVPTLLIHIPPANPSERASYLEEVRRGLIPEAARRALAASIDIFVEKEAWSATEAESLIHCARSHGLGVKLHSEQFHNIGGLELGIREKALSVDHLEACTSQQIGLLAGSATIATILPGVTLHLGIPAAPGRALIDQGAAVAVGTDLNPGSSPLYSTAAALALAVRLNGLTPAEALTAGTVNAASALALDDCGRIAPGCRADFLIMESGDWRDLVYALGANPVRELWIGGKRVNP